MDHRSLYTPERTNVIGRGDGDERTNERDWTRGRGRLWDEGGETSFPDSEWIDKSMGANSKWSDCAAGFYESDSLPSFVHSLST